MVSWFQTNQVDSYWQRLLYVVVLGALSGFAVLMSAWWGSSMLRLNSECERAGVNISNPPRIDSPVTSIIFVGDIMLGRDVESVSKLNGGYRHPFTETESILQSADITIGNLESPLIAGEAVPTESMVFRADEAWAGALAAAGFDILGLANNHIPNQGADGIRTTIAVLDEAGIQHAGAGETESAARQPADIMVGGSTVALLAYNDTDVVPDGYFAAGDLSGTAIMDIPTVAIDIAKARTRADWVCVFMHSGTEYAANPNQRQIEFAHAAIDAGADMVIGQHPHVVQSAELYRGKYIFYSLGNFVFDQMWSIETRQGIMLQLTLEGAKLISLRLMPIQIENYSQPSFIIDEPTARRVLDRLLLPYSSDIGDNWVVDMSIANDY